MQIAVKNKKKVFFFGSFYSAVVLTVNNDNYNLK